MGPVLVSSRSQKLRSLRCDTSQITPRRSPSRTSTLPNGDSPSRASCFAPLANALRSFHVSATTRAPRRAKTSSRCGSYPSGLHPSSPSTNAVRLLSTARRSCAPVVTMANSSAHCATDCSRRA